MTDITEPKVGVEVLIRGDGGVLWVNVDGICALRVCQIKPGQIVINDERQPEDLNRRNLAKKKRRRTG